MAVDWTESAADHGVTRQDMLAAAGELKTIPGRAVRGPQAAATGQAMLLGATGTSDLDDAIQLALGRPTLSDQRRGASPQWRIRVPQKLDAAAHQLARDRGVTLSTLVRQATADYIQASS